ncbi:aldehyde dehydrogenase family protein [Nocardia sp. NPDC049190]|uniref:aldehyde dehydrogenase family protein n=1 Tax=Nocardia sp. NPDC049190 TaxID=3155650 RepID=UPI0033F3EECE
MPAVVRPSERSRRPSATPRRPTTAGLRCATPWDIAECFERHEPEFAELNTLENDKTFGEASFEVGFAKDNFTTAAALAQTTYGRVMEAEPGKRTMVVREPPGVAAIINEHSDPP